MAYYCNGKGQICENPTKCSGCRYFDFAGGYNETITNADRIRAMSDEELAEFMADRNVNESTLLRLNENHGLSAVQIAAIKHNVYCACMRWLKQPAEE